MDHHSNERMPPKLADQFLRWFCREELIEEVLGDLHEYFEYELQDEAAWKAKLLYWYHILQFLRPFAIKKRLQNTHFIMIYQNSFKFAWRNIIKHKGSSLMNILTLSLGIGSFIFIFIYLKGELSYDRHHDDVERIHRVVIDLVNDNGVRLPDATTPPALAPNLKKDFAEVEHAIRIFPGWGSKFLLGSSDDKKFYEEEVIRTDSNFFEVFSFPMIYGDPNTALNDRNSIVITKKTALKYFGKEDVVGENLILFGSSRNSNLRVTGVLEDIPANSHFKFDFLSRLNIPNLDQYWGWYNFYTYIKLLPNTTMASLEPKLQAFYESYQDDEEDNNIIYSQAITDIHLKSNLKWELETNGDINNVYILSVLAIFVLIISCLNYLNLSVAESLKRFKEVGVRKTLGANKHYLISQFLAETLVITLIALAIGTLFAEFSFKNLGDLLGRSVSIFEGSNISFYFGICIVTLIVGLLAGLYPAFHLSSFNPALAVKGLADSSGKSVLGLRRGLMIIQFSISAFMIFCTISVYHQLMHIKNTDKGFDAEQVLVVENLRSVQNQEALKAELLNIPGVSNAGLSDGVVGGQNWTFTFGYPEGVLVNYLAIDPEFIETMDFEFVKGRNFSRNRPIDTADYTIILNETGLKDLGLTLEDVGKSIPLDQNDDTGEIIRGMVIGVVKDFHFADFKRPIKPFCFFFGEAPFDFINLQVSAANLNQTIRSIEKTWASFANEAPLEYAFIDESFSELHEKETRLSKILLFLTSLALFIAFMGMLASARITIKSRKKEISIRKVLGASVSGVTYLITRNFLWLVLLANAIAVPISFFIMKKWLQGFAYHTSISYSIFLLTIFSTLLVAAITVGSQSFRAALSNPVKNLKQE